jgi:general L-amino acid transport system substrate-binding protein
MLIQVGKLAAVATIGLTLATVVNAQVTTLDTIMKRGFLECGVNTGLTGFSAPDDKGNWSGFDVDYCKALAVAVLADVKKVKFVPMSAKERFDALRSGVIDVLIRNTTWTGERDSAVGISFTGVTYYDGQGFIVKTSSGVKSAQDLNGATVCVGAGTTTEINLETYFRMQAMTYKPLVFEKQDDAVQAYLAGRCNAYTTDTSGLYSVRVQLARPREHVILPEVISKEPLGPAVRQGDPQWFTIVKWVHFVLLNAEELGVTQATLDEMLSSADPGIKILLGKQGEFGKGLGLDNSFVTRIILAVGNYGEIFEANVGSGSRLKIARGLNNLWNKGGLQYAPPIR